MGDATFDVALNILLRVRRRLKNLVITYRPLSKLNILRRYEIFISGSY